MLFVGRPVYSGVGLEMELFARHLRAVALDRGERDLDKVQKAER
jgi:hypothetical protein